MALDQIWKQQLTLVTYGNEYLTQNLSFTHWVQHSIFNQHNLRFRDLLSQHLLAQHFQIWLEGLKRQGTQRISLHSSSLLNDEQNPNANVELLAIPHFIVSHEHNKKTAWIFGKELAEWYSADNDYEVPKPQQEQCRQETFWRFELNSKLVKRIDADLQQPNWDDIEVYTNNELFDSKFAQGFIEPTNRDYPYYGMPQTATENADGSALAESKYLPLLPSEYQADYAHITLHRLEALSAYIEQKQQHPYHADGCELNAEERLNLRHFSQKLDDLTAKFIVKAANHYQSARLTKVEVANPLDGAHPAPQTTQPLKSNKAHISHKVGASGVMKLILLTIVICVLAYYFGL
ncbi:hypothetical protein [Acinetobacter bouvetii]|uniref:Uncharacterized protein n=1 Tax=Acinetobacter bouvetii TaxID=202951 RepID=A0A811G6S5_9GAMM|nr:hypothetical protein [Acinetobacter bouvetii]CAB1209653.1 hypothetical protein SFB21_0580 [Acinetobacter bouvetii]